jgi:hypothetical protein
MNEGWIECRPSTIAWGSEAGLARRCGERSKQAAGAALVAVALILLVLRIMGI